MALFSFSTKNKTTPSAEKSSVNFDSLPNLLTIDQVSEILGVHPNTLRNWDRSGRLTAIRMGSRQDRRYDKHVVKELYEAQHGAPQSPPEPADDDSRYILKPGFSRQWIRLYFMSRKFSIFIFSVLLVAFSFSVMQVSFFAYVYLAQAEEGTTDLVQVAPVIATGWEYSQNGTTIDLLPNSAIDDFTDTNAAHYHNMPASEPTETAEITVESEVVFEDEETVFEKELITDALAEVDPIFESAGYTIPEDIDPAASIVGAEFVVSLAAAGHSTSEDVLVLSYSSDDGSTWQSLESFSLSADLSNAINEGYLTYTIDDLQQASDVEKLRFRIAYELVPTTATTIVYVDGVAIELEVEKPDPIIEEIQNSVSFENANTDLTVDEEPVLSVDTAEQSSFEFLGVQPTNREITEIVITDPTGDTIDVSTTEIEQTEGSQTTTEVQIDNDAFTKPGKYTVTMTVEQEGRTEEIVYDFTWGEIAINPDQSIYTVGQESLLSIGLVDDVGDIVCDAFVAVNIIAPDGTETLVNTDNGGITISESCLLKQEYIEPDYYAQHVVDQVGTYRLELTATYHGATRTATDSFEVTSTPRFTVQRDGPTRIYPKDYQPMTLTVTTYEDFSGTIRDLIPGDFEDVIANDGGVVTTYDTGSEIVWAVEWQVDLLAGSSVELRYTFKSIEKAPALYLGGPAMIGEDWDEGRQWQYVIDATYLYLLGADSTPGTGWTYISTFNGDFVRGAAAYSTAGGSATHTHTATQTLSSPSTLNDTSNGTLMDLASDTHSHGISNTIGTANNDPAHHTYYLYRYDTQDATPSTVPLDAFAFFKTGSEPSSPWVRFSAADSRLVKLDASHTTGGSDTHSHTVTWGSLTASIGTDDEPLLLAETPVYATDGHTHTAPIASVTNSPTAVPQNVTLKLYEQNGTPPSVPTGMIAMFDGTPPSGWTTISNASPYQDRYVQTANSSGTTAGTTSHTHSNVTSGNSGTPSATWDSFAPGIGSDFAGDNHTHTTSLVSWNSPAHDPLQTNFILAECTSCGGPSTIDLSGVAYQNNESSPIDGSGVNKTVTLTVNGSTTACGGGACTDEITASSGAWAITGITASSGDIVTVFLDNETEEGTTVFKSDGTNQTNVDIYDDAVIVRNDTGASVTNANLESGDRDAGDNDIKFEIGASDTMTVDSAFELHVWAGDTYDPNGTVTTQSTTGDLHVEGTAYLDTATSTIAGDIDIDGGTLNVQATTTVEANDVRMTSGALNHSAGTFTIGNSTTEDLILTGGTVTISGGNTIIKDDINHDNGTVNINTGANVDLTGTGTYDAGSGSNSALVLNLNGGSMDVAQHMFLDNGTINLNGGTHRAGVLTDGIVEMARHTDNPSMTFNMTGGELMGRAVIVYNNKTLNTTTVTGGTLTVDDLYSTVGSAIWYQWSDDSPKFYNLQFNDSANSYNTSNLLTYLNGDLIISSGTTLTVADENTTLEGNWDNDGTYVAGTSTVTMAGTGAINGTSDTSFYNLTVGDGTAGTVTVNGTDDPTVTNTLDVDTGDILSISSGRALTWTGSGFTLDGTISGAGRLTVASTTVIPTTGTLSSVVRFDRSSTALTNVPARTYGGDVEIYIDNPTASGVELDLGTAVSQTVNISGDLILEDVDVQIINLRGSTYNPTVNITGSIDFPGAGGTPTITTGTGVWSVGGNIDFTGGNLVATAGNTVVLNGSSTQTITSVSESFSSLTVSNTSGSYSGCSTSFTPGVDFADGATVTGTFTVNDNGKVEYNSGSTYAFTNIDWTGTSGNEIIFRNSNLLSGTWSLNVTNSSVVSYVDVARSDATPGVDIDADDGTNIDCSNNTAWIFGLGTTVSGTSNSAGSVKIAVNGSLQADSDIIGGGTWSLVTDSPLSGGETITAFIDGASTAGESTAVTEYDGTGDITGMVLDTNTLSVGSDDTGVTLTVTQLGQYDNDQDEDIMHSANASNLRVDDDNVYGNDTIDIMSGDTLTIGGTETLTAHNVTINGSLTSGGASTYTIGGTWDNNSDFNSSTETITLATIGTDTFDNTGATDYDVYNIVRNGSSTMTFTGSTVTINNTLAVNSGTLSIGVNTNVNGDVTTVTVAGGTLTQTAGVLTIGNGAAEDFAISSGAANFNGGTTTITDEVDISGGTVTIANTFNLTNTASNFEVIGGTVNINSGADVNLSDRIYMHGPKLTTTMNIAAGSTIDSQDYWLLYNGTFNFNGGTHTVGTSTGFLYINDSGDGIDFNMTGSGTITTDELYASNTVDITTTTTTGGTIIIDGGANGIDIRKADINFYNITVATTTAIDTNSVEINLVNDLTVNGFQTLTTNSETLDIEGDLIINGNATVTAANSAISIAGNFDDSGSFSTLLGTVTMDGTNGGAIQGSSNTTFYNLNISPTAFLATVDILETNDPIVNGTLAINNQSVLTFDTGRTITVDNTGTFTFGAGTFLDGAGTLIYQPAAAFPTGGSITGTTTVRFDTTSNSQTMSSRLYGHVEIYGNNTSNTVTAAAGSYNFNNLNMIQDGTGTTVFDMNTNDPTLTAAGDVTIGANTTLQQSNINTFDLNGDFTRTGTHTHNGGTVLFSGTAQQTVTGTSPMGNVTITNTSGSFSGCSSSFTPGVDFAAGFNATLLTITTGAVKVEFESGATYNFGTINLNGGGTDIIFRNSNLISGSHNFYIGGSPVVVDVNVARSNASGGSAIDASDGTSVDCGSNTNWTFPIPVTNIAGSSNSSGSVKVAVDGVVQAASSTISGSAWSLDTDAQLTGGEVVIAFINGATELNESTAITIYDGAGNITGMVLDQNVLSVGSADNPNVDRVDFWTYENGDDEDVMHGHANYSCGSPGICLREVDVDHGNSYGNETLRVLSGATLTVNATYDGSDGIRDLYEMDNIQIDGSVTTTSQLGVGPRFDIFGSWDNNSDFNSTDETINFRSTGTDTIDNTGATDSDVEDVTFNGSGGQWTLNSTWTVNGSITMSLGTFTVSNALAVTGNIAANAGTINGTSDITVQGNFSGDGTVTMTGGTVTLDNDTTFGGNTGWTFNNLVLGYNAACSAYYTTTATGSGSVTVTGRMSNEECSCGGECIRQTSLSAGAKDWIFTASGTSPSEPLELTIVISDYGTSTLRYTGSGTTDVRSSSYNLELIPASGTPTYNLQGGTVLGNLLIHPNAGLNLNHGTNSLRMNGDAKTIDAGGSQFYDFYVDGTNNTVTVTNTDFETTRGFAINTGNTLTIGASRVVTFSGSIWATSGTVDGSGMLTITDASTGPSTTGTISTKVRYDATNGDIASGTFDARAYGGDVEVYSNSGGILRNAVLANGVYAFNGNFDVTCSACASLTTNFNTNDPLVTIAGDTTISSSSTLEASDTNVLTMNGNYTNSGIFKDNSGSVTLGGSTTQTLSGTMTGVSGEFNNLTITNNSGTAPVNCGLSVIIPSVDFAGSATIAGKYTATTSGTIVEYNSGSTYTVSNGIELTGASGAGNAIYFYNSDQAAGSHNFNVSGTQTDVSYVDVRRSNASGGDEIQANNGTNTDCNNNTNWRFIGILVSGTSNEAGTVRVAINSTLQSGSDVIAGGTWSFYTDTTPAAGNIITAFITGAATGDESSALTEYDGSGDVTGMVLDTNTLTVGSNDTTPTLTRADFDQYSNATNEDVMFGVLLGTCLDGDCSYTVRVDDDDVYADDTINILSGAKVTMVNDASVTETFVADNVIINGELESTNNPSYNIEGNWDNNGTFTEGTSTVRLQGTVVETTTIDSTGAADASFYTLNISTNGTKQTASTLTTTGGISNSGGTLTINHDTQVNGGYMTMALDGTYNTTANTPTVTISGTGSVGDVTGTGTGSFTVYDLATSGTGTSTIVSDVTANNTVTVGSGTTLTLSTGDLTSSNNTTVNGTLTIATDTYTVGDGTTEDLVVDGGVVNVSGTGTLHIQDDLLPTINGATEDINFSGGTINIDGDLQSNLTSDYDITGGTTTVLGNLDINFGAVDISATVNVTGYLDLDGGAFDVNAGADINVTNEVQVDTIFANLDLNGGSLDSSTNWRLNGGTINLDGGDHHTGDTAILEIANTATAVDFSMTGGDLSTRALLVYGAGNLTTSTVTGGTIRVGIVPHASVNIYDVNTNAHSFYNIQIDETGYMNSLTTEVLSVMGTFGITSGKTFNANNEDIQVTGAWDNDGTFTAATGEVILLGANINGTADTTFNDLTIGNGLTASSVTVNGTDDPFIGGALVIDNADTLSISASRTVTLNSTGSLALPNATTISGAGRFTYRPSAAIPTTGTISSIWRYDTLDNNHTFVTRTYGPVEVFNSTAFHRTATLGSGTPWVQGDLTLIADGSGNMSLLGQTNNPGPIVNTNLDFTGTGGGTEIINSGTGQWAIGGSIDFRDGTYTATTANTLTMNGGGSHSIWLGGNELYTFTTSGTGTHTMNDAAVINNQLSIGNSTTLVGPSSTLNLKGDYVNTVGEYTHNNGTVILSGTGAQALTGQMTGATDRFYNLTISNSSGTIDFNDGAEIENNYTITTAGVTVTHEAGETFTFQNINWAGSSGVGNEITFQSSTTSQYNMAVNGTQTDVSYVDVAYSDACTGSNWIDASNGTNTNSGNNDCWMFTSITVSGNIFDNTEVGFYNCSSDNLTLHVAQHGARVSSATCTSAGGAYSITAAAPTGAGDNLIVYIDSGETPQATTATTTADAVSNITGLHLIDDNLVLRHEDAGPISNSDLAAADDGDAGVLFSISGSDLTVNSGVHLHVNTGDAYDPNGKFVTVGGGQVHLDDSSTATADTSGNVSSGTLVVDTGAVLTLDQGMTFGGDGTVEGTIQGTGDINVNGGDLTGDGTVNMTGGDVTLFDDGTIGGNTNWTFYDLSLSYTTCNTDVTTALGTGDITVTNTLIGSTCFNLETWVHSIDLGSKTLILTATGEPLQAFLANGHTNTSIVRYTGSGATTTVRANAYHDLELSPTSSTTYDAGALADIHIHGDATFNNNVSYSASTSNLWARGATTALDLNGETLYNFSMFDDGIATVTNTDFFVSNIMDIDTDDTLNIPSGRTAMVTSTGTLTLDGTISGAGMLTYQPAAAFPTTGTISAKLRFDASNNDQIMSARTYGGDVEPFVDGTVGVNRTLTLGTATSQTINVSGNWNNRADHVTYYVDANANTYDPTVNITGNLTGENSVTGGGRINAGAGTWTVTGNVDLGYVQYFPETGNTLVMDGAVAAIDVDHQIIGGWDSDPYNFQTAGSGTITWNDSGTIDGDVTIGDGTTLTGSVLIIINGGNLTTPGGTGTGVVNMTGGRIEITDEGNIGGNSDWTFNDLTFNQASCGTKNVYATGSGSMTINGVLATTRCFNFEDRFVNLHTGTKEWILTASGGLGGEPFQNSGNTVFDTSTFRYTGTADTFISFAGSGGSLGYYNLILEPAGGSNPNYTLEGAIIFHIENDFTIGDNSNSVTIDGTTYDPGIYVGNDLSCTFSAGTHTVNTGTGTWNIDGNVDLTSCNGWSSTTGHTLEMGGTAKTLTSDNESLYNFTVSGGSITLESPLDALGDVSITAGSLDTKGGVDNAIEVGGNWSNAATFTSNFGTVTFDATDAGNTIAPGGSSFFNVVFDGVGGAWASTAAMDVNGTFDVTNGGFTQDAATNLNVAGNFTLANGTTFTKAAGVGLLIFDGDLAFADNTSPQQDLGSVEIGTSPDTTTLTTDFSATNLKVNTGDVLNTDGYEVDLSNKLDCEASCTLDLTDTGEGDGTIITFGGDWTMNASGTFTASTDSRVEPDGNATQTVTTGGKTFNDFYVNNTHASEDVRISGTFDVNGDVTVNDGILDFETNDPTVNIEGAVSISSGATLTASSTGTFTVAGDWTNNGDFTDGTGTVTLDGTSTQTLSGQMTGASDRFYNLTITNAGASNPDIDFAAAADTANNFVANTASTQIEFNAGSTYTLQNIDFDGQATGTRVTLRSSSDGTQWNINVAGTRSVSNTNVKDSDACGQAPDIDATDGTNFDAANNDCWNFNTITFSISDTTIGFGTLSSIASRYANGAGTGSATEVEAHTLSASTTNSGGYVITINGSTLTNATSDTISAIGGTNTTPSTGTEQFGIRATASGGSGSVNAPYAASGFALDTGAFPDIVASSSGSSTTTTYSLRYLGNISTTTESGEYSGDITYIMTPTF